MRTQLALPKKGAERGAPCRILGPCVLWPNGWMYQNGTWRGGGPWSRPHCAPYPKQGQSPQFSAHLYCGETAGCIKMPLGIKVGLSPGDSVLDGDPAPLPTKGMDPSPPQFSAHFYCGQKAEKAGCIKMTLGMEVGLSPGDFVLDGDPPPPLPKKEAEPGGRAPNFRPMSIVAKQLD